MSSTIRLKEKIGILELEYHQEVKDALAIILDL